MEQLGPLGDPLVVRRARELLATFRTTLALAQERLQSLETKISRKVARTRACWSGSPHAVRAATSSKLLARKSLETVVPSSLLARYVGRTSLAPRVGTKGFGNHRHIISLIESAKIDESINEIARHLGLPKRGQLVARGQAGRWVGRCDVVWAPANGADRRNLGPCHRGNPGAS